MKYRRFLTLILIVAFAGLVLATSNIDPASKHSWGENIGWMNWRDADGGAAGVHVGPDFLSGAIWCENVGWIRVGGGSGPYANTDDSNYGVNIDVNSDLSGYAWGENIGWVNFGWADAADPNRPRIDAVEHRFRGYAWAENVGWVNLNDATHYVAYEGCVEDGDCEDGDLCTWDRCTGGLCEFVPNTYGDVDHNGVLSLFDIFCILDGIGGDFSTCSLEDDDIAGSGPQTCGPNGVLNLFDVFAVLDAIAGIDPCCGGVP